jgi:release factor glutamine methyltransferase
MLGKFLKEAAKLLSDTSPTPELDARIIISKAVGQDVTWVLAHSDYILSAKQKKVFDKMLNRRLSHEPIAYITGEAEFYGRIFNVSSDTLQPRPETETLVEQLLLEINQKSLKKISLIDVGTGSGNIVITASAELNNTTNQYLATDVSAPALKIAKQNSIQHAQKIDFFKGSLLKPVLEKILCPDIIIAANLPYVPTSHPINKAARHEPDIAIFGGVDGLDIYRNLFGQVGKLKFSSLSLITECLPPQQHLLNSIAKKHNLKMVRIDDFIQVFRN